MIATRRTPFSIVAVAVLALAGCGGTDGAVGTTTPTIPGTDAPATTAEATTTTFDPTADARAYAERGPHAVGVTTLTLAKGPSVEVWYPAVDGSTGTETYDVRDFTPEAIRGLLTGDATATYSYEAARDADVADGAYPVVLFSHGFTGMRLQSSFLTSHLASWGMIVVSPDHPSRDLANVLGGTASGDRADAVDDLLSSLDLITAQGTDGASLFAGHVDVESVVAVGHSAGGGTVLGAAEDPRIDGYVSLASGAFLGASDTSTSVAPSLPAKPSFFMAGAVDAVVSPETRTRPSFEVAPSPSLLWILEGVGHNGFDDFCTFGNGTGIIGVAEASGLGPLLDAQPQLRSLGEDGCIAPAVAVEETFPVINHGVTAWIRQLFGVDAAPVGITPDYATAFAVPVEIVTK
jgi:dienelactone hydrolase